MIRVVDPFFQPAPDAEDGSEKPQRPESLLAIDLDEDEAAFSVAVVTFVEKPGELCLVVGTAKNVSLSPRTTSGGFLRLYQISADGKSLEYMHKVGVSQESTDVRLTMFLSRHRSTTYRLWYVASRAIFWLVSARL